MRFLFCLLLLIGILPLIFSSSINSAIEKYGGGYLNDDEAAPWVPEGHPFRSHPYWFGSRDKQKEIMTPLVVAEAPHWTYERSNEEHGPYVWDKIDKRCGGTKQSPINFEPTNIKKDRSLGRIQENWRNLQNGVISHNGHTIIYNVNPAWTTDKQYHILKGGSLNKGSIYKLLQFHIHIGSEHTFSWAQYPLELHAVHINNDPNKAVEGNPEELAVVGFTFRETRKDNPALEPFVSAAERLMTARKTNPSATITIPSFNLTALIPQKNNYFSYPGSLTTPNCRESVQWHVYEEQVPIGGRQLEKLIAAQGFSNNYRNTQSYNGRVIKGYRP